MHHFGSPPIVKPKKRKKGKSNGGSASSSCNCGHGGNNVALPTVEGSTEGLATVKHPAHYPAHPSGIEPIQIAEHESFFRGNIIKYVMRAPYKGDELKDLLKAQEYLEREIVRVKNGESQ